MGSHNTVSLNLEALRAEAERWIGTPWRIGSRVPGPDGGTDCAGPTHAVLVAAGVLQPEPQPPRLPVDYGYHNHHSPIEEYIQKYYSDVFTCCDPSNEEPVPGDVLGLHYGKIVYHSAVMVTAHEFIHSRPRAGTRLSSLNEPRYRKGLRCIWRPVIQ